MSGRCAASRLYWAPAPALSLAGRHHARLWLRWRGRCAVYRPDWRSGRYLGCDDAEKWLRVDDPCDVFGVHGVCGIIGCILTGVFASGSLGGVGYAEGVTMGHQVWVQLLSVALTIIWTGVVAFIGFKVADMLVGLRVPEEQEREGLDVNSHGENAYNQ